MSIKRPFFASAAAALALCAPASASVPHVVQPGETLWSIAAANNFTTRALAAANGLSPDAHVVQGTTIQIPSVTEAAEALEKAGYVSEESGSSSTSSGAGAAVPPLGSYVVRPGDTLSSIAARSRVTLQAVAAMNGVDPGKPLLIGTVLKLPTGAQLNPATPAPSNRVVPNAAPYPTAERVSGSTIAQIAAADGVPASLAEALAWQESGFNNDLVSSANARGVMQLLPGTWAWVNSNLAHSPLNPNSAFDNVNAGVMFLGQLLRDTGGDIPQAVAAYYQGLDSVRQSGMLPDTQRYVDNVLALRSRFGGT